MSNFAKSKVTLIKDIDYNHKFNIRWIGDNDDHSFVEMKKNYLKQNEKLFDQLKYDQQKRINNFIEYFNNRNLNSQIYDVIEKSFSFVPNEDELKNLVITLSNSIPNLNDDEINNKALYELKKINILQYLANEWKITPTKEELEPYIQSYMKFNHVTYDEAMKNIQMVEHFKLVITITNVFEEFNKKFIINYI